MALDILIVVLFLSLLTLLVKPLGAYMAAVYEDKPVFLTRIIKPIERLIYKVANVKNEEMTWKQYAIALMFFNILGGAALLSILLFQQYLPFNPEHFPGFKLDLAINAAVSFITNTNWQNYAGESSASYFSQIAGLMVQQFLSAATGLCILVVLVRGLVRRTSQTIGNFWNDMVKSVLYVLLPLAMVIGIILVSQGAIMNWSPYVHSTLLQPTVSSDNKQVTERVIPMGPVAAQEAIKDLGTNGGGFFNANSAHPFENPTPLTNLLEILALLLIPAASTYMFGRMVGDGRQGWTIYLAMLFLFIVAFSALYCFESQGIPVMKQRGISGTYMEGKEVRFGLVGTALFATATTVTSTGSVNGMHDSLTPIGGLVTMMDIGLGEVAFGGVGSGLYTMLAFIIIAVFVAGLMIGRIPDYLGNKIEPREMWLSVIIVLASNVLVLVFTAFAIILPVALTSLFNPGAHGLSEALYAFMSMANNNGSAFAGLSGNIIFYNIAGAAAMLIGRYLPAIAAIALAGSFAGKKFKKPTHGTLQTHGAVFAIWLIFIILIIGALSYFSAVSAGPIVEQLKMIYGG